MRLLFVRRSFDLLKAKPIHTVRNTKAIRLSNNRGNLSSSGSSRGLQPCVYRPPHNTEADVLTYVNAVELKKTMKTWTRIGKNPNDPFTNFDLLKYSLSIRYEKKLTQSHNVALDNIKVESSVKPQTKIDSSRAFMSAKVIRLKSW